MNTMLFLTQFLYRIRYWLLWGTLFVTGVVVYFTQFLPYSYTVTSTIYAGVTTATSLDGSGVNFSVVTATFDNLINIGKSRSTLEKVSLRLLANAYTYGEEWQDNTYIQSKHYRQLLQMTPPEVMALVDRKDAEKTLEHLTAYSQKGGAGNFLYSVFNRPIAFYSAQALNGITIKRIGSSDIIEVEYTSADPGLTQQTVAFVIEELTEAYRILRYKSTTDVIAYFEEQVQKAKKELNESEDDLMHYNVREQVINYGEESKVLATTRYEVEDRYEEVERAYESAVALRQLLDDKMDVRAQIIRNNTNLLQELNRVSTLNQNIMEQEIFTSEGYQQQSDKLQRDRESLKKAEENISHISDNLNEFNFSKEGVGIESMVDEWLQAMINEAKAKAEFEVLKRRMESIIQQYAHMSPIGTQVSRKERAVDIAEDNYRTQLDGLANSRLRLKNIEMSTSDLRPIAPPTYPLTDNGRKRSLYVIISMLSSIVLIIGYFLLIEIVDRTLRDAHRCLRLTGLPVIAAFNGTSNLKFRGFLKVCNRLAAAYSCRRFNKYLTPGQPSVINLFSFHSREGKSFLAKFFIQYWEREGLVVRHVVHDEDFNPSAKEYVQATSLSDFWVPNEAEQRPDIILVEYPALTQATLPLQAMKSANINLLVANARRTWHSSDSTTLQPIREALQEAPLWIYLNNADRDVVESFTGDLPPKTMLHTFLNRFAQLGLTSKGTAVK